MGGQQTKERSVTRSQRRPGNYLGSNVFAEHHGKSKNPLHQTLGLL